MADDWHARLLERLAAAAGAAGGWGYRPECAGSAEPTAWTTLALTAWHVHPALVSRGLGWLAAIQRPDGAVPIYAGAPGPWWGTAAAILAWSRCGAAGYADAAERAWAWLLAARGVRPAREHAEFDHDTSLLGWPWVAGTSAWIEPTAMAVLAARAMQRGAEPRVQEGRRLILDRALPDGGWNYGNRRVLGNALRPDPATTGIALTALAGQPPQDPIKAASGYLTAELARVRTPISLAWGLLGLRAWSAAPPAAESWLAVCAARVLAQPPSPASEALLLLARSEPCPLLAEADHG